MNGVQWIQSVKEGLNLLSRGPIGSQTEGGTSGGFCKQCGALVQLDDTDPCAALSFL